MFSLRRKYLRTHLALVRMQATCRMKMLRRRFLEMKESALVIQTRLRGTLLAKEQREIFLKMKDAVIRIQSIYRMHKSKKILLHLQEERKREIRRRASVVIQSSWKGRRQRIQFLKEKMSCVVIQSWWRSVSKRKEFLMKKRAVMLIQEHWRLLLLGRVCREKFLIKRRSVVKMQSSVRRHFARKHLLRLREAKMEEARQDLAALCIQRIWKGARDRRRFLHQRTAAIRIQSWWKCKSESRNFSALKLAAIRIQRRRRGLNLMRDIRSDYLNLRFASVRIQSGVRMTLCRRNFMKKKTASITLQSFIRSWSKRRRFLHQRDSVLKIQSWFRCVRTRRAFLDKKSSSLCIQRHWRSVLLSRDARREFICKRKSAVKMQSAIRGYLQRCRYLEARKAAIVIQQRWRSILASRRIREDYLALRRSTIMVQALIRRYFAMKRYKILLLTKRDAEMKLKAATIIQSHWRGYQDMKKMKMIRDSCIKIQTRIRSWSKRKRYKLLKSSSILIQQRWRATLLCRSERSKYLALMSRMREEDKAAVIIQSVFRGFIARRSYHLLLEERATKRKIQLMMITMAIKDHLAAIKIQRAYRDYASLKRWKHFNDKIITIQRWWKTKVTRARFKKTIQSVTLIQTTYRRHLNRRIKSVVRLQSYFRVILARNSSIKRREAIITLQTYWRGSRVRREMQLFPGIAFHRNKIEEATKRASLHPETRIRSRTTKALRILFNQKYFNQILTALIELENVSSLLGGCCERIAEDGGADALMKLVSSCNRDFGSVNVIKLSLQIITNLLKTPISRLITFSTLSENLDVMVEVISKYQDRGCRDKSTRPVFILACNIMTSYLADSHRAQIFFSAPNIASSQRLHFILKDTQRRITKQSERINIEKRIKERKTVTYLNDSSMMADKSCVRERSFVRGMFGTLASTSTPDRLVAPKLPDHVKPKGKPLKPNIKAPLSTVQPEARKKRPEVRSSIRKPVQPRVGALPNDLTKEMIICIQQLMSCFSKDE